MSDTVNDPRNQVRQLAAALSQVRNRPCLLFSTPTIHECSVQALRAACQDQGGNVDVIVHGPGGCICCAYRIARELHRRFEQVTVFVPAKAKSAATLIALAADELVLGELGELGPLDAQFSKSQKADAAPDRSCLERFQALNQVQQHARETFGELVQVVMGNSEMGVEEAARIATEFTARTFAPMYSQIDPASLAAGARDLEVGLGYADRVLRRYRPQLYAEHGPAVIQHLVNGYPSHGFVIDLEELADLGIPARGPAPEEAPILSALADALQHLDGSEGLIELASYEAGVPPDQYPAHTNSGEHEAVAPRCCDSRHGIHDNR